MTNSDRLPTLDRKGGTLALFAVLLTGLLAVSALAVDVGMAFNARSEAQRVADAAALAGGSAFIEFPTPATAASHADQWARDLATSNNVHGTAVQASEVAVDVRQGPQEVAVTITREDIPVWFARLLGIFDLDVQAQAVARVSDGGTVNQCVLPVALPDFWDDPDSDTVLVNGRPDPGEEWNFDGPPDDTYVQWNPGTSSATGYGRPSLGETINFEVPGGGPTDPFGPWNFLEWNMPNPGDGCPPAGSASGNWVTSCNSCSVGIGSGFHSDPGTASTLSDLTSILGQDGSATWDSGCNCVRNSAFGDPRDSPRVRPIALYHPAYTWDPGSPIVTFDNFAWVFLEPGGPSGVRARFMGTIRGGEPGPGMGPLVQYLRLVQ